jgi:transposase-like protein
MGRARLHGARRGERAWAKIVQEFQSSGISQQAFCRREGIALSSLQRWRQRIGSSSGAGFVELVPTESAPRPSTASWALDLTLPNGVSIRFQG